MLSCLAWTWSMACACALRDLLYWPTCCCHDLGSCHGYCFSSHDRSWICKRFCARGLSVSDCHVCTSKITPLASVCAECSEFLNPVSSSCRCDSGNRYFSQVSLTVYKKNQVISECVITCVSPTRLWLWLLPSPTHWWDAGPAACLTSRPGEYLLLPATRKPLTWAPLSNTKEFLGFAVSCMASVPSAFQKMLATTP